MRTTFPLVGLPHLTGHRVPAEYRLAVKGQYQHPECRALIKPVFIPLDAGTSGGNENQIQQGEHIGKARKNTGLNFPSPDCVTQLYVLTDSDGYEDIVERYAKRCWK
ncbi:hypothetical protein [Enterobacter kobei]|uniref:hypothetical protein n=1 Tax=Enterobacter kobei TaxID=208224 RepID=UPI003CEF55B9